MNNEPNQDKKKPGPEPETLKINPDEIDEALDKLVSDRPKPKPKG